MTRHSHDEGELREGSVDYDHVVHRRNGMASLLVVTRSAGVGLRRLRRVLVR
jgi:hypothetical protein